MSRTSPVSYPLTHALVQVMESYAKCLQQNLNLVEPSLVYILPLLTSPRLHRPASRAFAGVCSKGREYLSKGKTMAELIGAITGQYRQIPRDSMELCVEAMGRVVSVLGNAAMMEALTSLTAPFLERLRVVSAGQSGMFVQASALVEVAELVKLVGAAIRFIEPLEMQHGEQHPVASVIQVGKHAAARPSLASCRRDSVVLRPLLCALWVVR